MFENLFNINRLSKISDVTSNYFKNIPNSKKDDTSKSDIGSKIETKNFIISKGGEVFRQKLIDYFVPNKKYQSKKLLSITAKDLVSSKGAIDEIILKSPNELVRFTTYPKINRLHLDEGKRLRSKICSSKVQIFKDFLVKILNGKYFKNTLVALLILDALLIGVTVNLSVSENKVEYKDIITVLLSLQATLTAVFLVESLCQIYIDHKNFFTAHWNKLDISLTLITTLFEIMNIISFHFSSNQTNDLKFRVISDLRVFRILRLFKVISHFMQLRIITLALTKAFNSVFLITILLIIFTYIYAIVGVVLFEDMLNRIDNILINDCFANITDALLTLFAVMTLDQWWVIFSNASESNDNDVLTTVYFMSWILLAAFIFQNLFTGAMVNNFQQIRENIENQINSKGKHVASSNQEVAENAKAGFNENMLLEDDDRHDSMKSSSADDSDFSDKKSLNENDASVKRRKNLKKVLKYMKNKRDANTNWLNTLNKNIELIEDIKSSNKEATLWPEDTLLHYYGLMQTLMDNLHERMILLDYANNVLLLMHDRDNTLYPLNNYDNATKKNN